MTSDPDDYDLRELRRIADERRAARRSDGAGQSEDESRRPEHRERRSGEARRNGRKPHRNGRSTERSDVDRRKQESPDEPQADDVTVRPRDRDGRSQRPDQAANRDEVVRADRIARDLGFGDDKDGRRRDGRTDRRRERRPRHDAGGRPDDVGSFQFDPEVRERPRSRPGKALREAQLEQLLIHETAASEGLAKPYLTDLPDAYAAERLVFDWLEFLVLKGGFKRAMDALRYYRTVEWLTADAEAELRDYLVGFSGEVTDTEAYDVDDHHLSLVYIARLSSMT